MKFWYVVHDGIVERCNVACLVGLIELRREEKKKQEERTLDEKKRKRKAEKNSFHEKIAKMVIANRRNKEREVCLVKTSFKI